MAINMFSYIYYACYLVIVALYGLTVLLNDRSLDPMVKKNLLVLRSLTSPCAKQSDPTVLDLQLRAISKQTTSKAMTVCIDCLTLKKVWEREREGRR